MGWFILGFCVGGMIGVTLMCLMIMAQDKEEIGRLQATIQALEDDNQKLREKMNNRKYMEIYGEDKAELYREDGDPGSHAYCTECGKLCRPQKRDYGYESGHHVWVWESPCCDAQVSEYPVGQEEA